MLATADLIRENAAPADLVEQLPRWLRQIPLYHRHTAGLNGVASLSFPELFRRLPFITKSDIRRGFPANFLPSEVSLDDLLQDGLVELEHTSGTSEERTPLLLKLGWWKEQETRALRLNPLVDRTFAEFPDPRRIVISSPVCSGEICYTGVPALSERTLGNARYVSLSRLPFLWGQADLARMAAETAQWQPQFLDVDPVYGVVFARYCERQRIRFPSLQFVICSYEFVSLVHRQIIERALGVPVFNLYGSTETGHLLMETAPGVMRPSLETAYLEQVNTDSAGIGDLIVTTLTNDYMPLIRYRIGDLVETRVQPCQTNYVVHGRAMDAIPVADRRITPWQVDQCFAGTTGVAHYQLLRADDRFVLRFVPDHPTSPDPATLDLVRSRLAALLQQPETAVVLKPVDLLMPESSGKFRLVTP